MCLIVSTGGTIGFFIVDGNFKWWQYCIAPLGSLLMILTPILWYLTCHGLMRAAKTLGDEIEQV
jgi:hypothetical protein